MKIRKNDQVLVTAGKDRGKKGKVRSVDTKEGKVLVDGVNLVRKHARPTGQARQGGIIEFEAPLPISNVMLICSKCRRPVRVGHRFLAEGKKVRVCKSCGEVID